MKVYSVITLFPESIEPYLRSSILKRAQESLAPKGSKKGRKAVIAIQCIDPKKYVRTTKDKKTRDKKTSERVDDKPYAGGPGMVLRAEPLLKAAENAAALANKKAKKKISTKKTAYIFLTPQGNQFDQEMAQELATFDHVVFFSGRYEGIDARVREICKAREVSVGPFILTGGELPAALMIDAVARHVPGVLGSGESREEERTASPHVYTRPEILKWKKKKYRVPEVLLSGDHKKIEEWRSAQRALQTEKTGDTI